MDPETKAVCIIVTMISAALIVIFGGGYLYNAHYNRVGTQAITDMVRAGANPIDAECAAWARTDSSACAIRALSGRHQP